MFLFTVIPQGRRISHPFAFTLNRKEPKQTEEMQDRTKKEDGTENTGA